MPPGSEYGFAPATDSPKNPPADLSIVGFHDAPIATYLDPPLTTVRMPLAEMGGSAVEILLAVINGETVDDLRVGMPPELVVRASSAPPPP